MYAFGSVSVTFNNTILLGFVTGTPVTFKRNVPRHVTEVGADGLGTDVRSSNNSCICEVTLQSSSPTVAALNAAAAAGTRGTLVIRDNSGSELNRMVCRVAGEADSAYGDTLTERKFTFTGISGSTTGGGGHDL